MRHIPEDELHAYLDQGLSRSQCVEIESHLAACPSCQAARDGIAALRDRTTALLARLAPPRSFPAPFESLRRRAAIEVSAHRRRVHVAAWAASIVAAVGVGFGGSLLLIPGNSDVPITQAANPTVRPAVTVQSTNASGTPSTPAVLRESSRTDSASSPAPRRRVAVARRAAQPAAPAPAPEIPPVVPAPELELSSVDMPRKRDLEFDGMWRTMSWDGAQAEAGDKLPHIDGLPVVQVQVQASRQGKQPLMVVAQQLSSGEVIRTIEGPTTDVSHLLSRRTMSDPQPNVAAADSSSSFTTGNQLLDRTMAMQRGDRMLAITGALPPDSLLAMIRRLNAEMRSK